MYNIIKEIIKSKKSSKFNNSLLKWRHHPDLNWGIKVLQTSALPLGYGAVFAFSHYLAKV